MSGNYQNADESASFRQMLLNGARPELYRGNAFRVLGLPVSVTEREIRKHLREAELRREFGGGASVALKKNGLPAPLPLSPLPDAESVAEAQARLARPERRFVDEFFWFWSNEVEAFEPLMRNDIEAASNFWVKRTESADTRWLAVHDMAIMFHAAALDIEWAAVHNLPIRDEWKQQLDKYWQNSIAIWRLTLTRAEVWEHLARRVGEVDDPRVTLAMVDELRAALPVMLLSINARLAAQASLHGATAEAQRHTAIMRDFNFDEESIEEARQIVVEPLRRRIYDLCQALNREAKGAPESADQSIQRVWKESRSILKAINDQLPERDSRINDSRDALAGSLNDAAIGKYERLPPGATQQWELAKQFFERIRVIAASPTMRQVIEKNIAWAAGNLPQPGVAPGAQQPQSAPPPRAEQKKARQTCWFCMRREEEGFPEVVRLYKGAATQNPHEDVFVPRCAGCYAIHSRASNLSTWGGIAGAAAGVSLCVGFLANFWTEIGSLLEGRYVFQKTILLLLGLAFFLFGLYSIGQQIVYRKVWPNVSGGIKPIEQRMSFPRVAELQRLGWSHHKQTN